MSEVEVKRHFLRFLAEYHREIQTDDPEEKLRAIAKFQQHISWLHPPIDGTLRTSTLLLNKHLVENGFHPAYLDWPGICFHVPFEEWLAYLKQGLKAWEERD